MRSTTFRSRCVVSAIAVCVGASFAGEASAGIVLSNLPGSGTGSFSRGHAVQFTTGSGSWNLQSASFYGAFSFSVSLEIWTVDGTSSPVAGTLVGSTSVSGGALVPATYDLVFSGSGLSLDASTSYWAVFTSIFFAAPETATVPSTQNNSGWSGSDSAFSNIDGPNFEPVWTAATNIVYSLNATSVSVIPGAGVAGLATLGLAGFARRRRR